MKMEVISDALFWGKDPFESIRKIAEAGQTNLEFWMWYDKPIDRMLALQNEFGLNIEVITVPSMSLEDKQTPVGFSLPENFDVYIDGLKKTIEYAKRVGCKKLSTQLGPYKGGSREEQFETMLAGLKKVLPILEENNITLMIEPQDLTGSGSVYKHSASEEAFMLVEQVNNSHVRYLFDVYFEQKIHGGNVLERMLNNLDKIAHLHVAGSCGRHEITNGELNYPFIFNKLDAAGYTGYAALEYFPEEDPIKGVKAFL